MCRSIKISKICDICFIIKRGEAESFVEVGLSFILTDFPETHAGHEAFADYVAKYLYHIVKSELKTIEGRYVA